MGKRHTPVVLMYMAYLIIMVHAIIPHHHHDDAVCLQSVQHTHQHCSHDNNASDHTSHKGCKLSQADILSPDNLRVQKITYPSFEITGITLSTETEEHVLPFSPIDLSVEEVNPQLTFIVNAQILRAPPVA